jgi:transposase
MNPVMEVVMLIQSQYRTSKNINALKKLLAKCEHANDLRIWKRAKSVLLYLQNKKPYEISDLMEVGLKSVYRWLNQYDREGVDGLYEGNHTGRPSLLTKAQLEVLEDILESGPIAYGLTTGIWTSPTVQHIIEEEFGIRYHHDHVRKILHAMGFSVQRPTRKLALAKPELQQKWVRRTYPALKKSAKKQME